jgi:flagellar basal-body rod modification protein FlgD
MTTDTLTSTTSSALASVQQSTNPSRSETDRKKLAEDFDSFLLLLTTQLKNQDPTEPLDTNEFTQQLVQFASVEQQVATNENIEKLVAATVSAGIQQAIGYIGKAIEAEGDKGVLTNGEAYFAYELPAGVSSANINILDEAGRVVFSGAGNTAQGKTVAFWDGKNSFNQSQMPDGTYQLVVTAKGFNGEDIKARTLTTGRVDSAQTDAEGNIVLSVGSARVKIGDVLSVREVPDAVQVADNETTTPTTPAAGGDAESDADAEQEDTEESSDENLQ